MGGTSISPRRPNGNIDWEEVYNRYVRDIIRNQISPNTGRGLMYILKSKGILVKSDYNQLIVHLRDWRKDGRICWNQIADGSGRGIINDFSDLQSPDLFFDRRIQTLRNGGEIYRQILDADWRWYGQKHYVEFWLEKHAITGTVGALVGDRYVRVGFNKGNPGWGYMHDNCERLKGELYTTGANGERMRRKILLCYLGDKDKQGEGMDHEIRNQLEFFGMLKLVDFKRIAVTKEQVKTYHLPANFESGEGYEVDALNAYNPKEFAKLIDSQIEPYSDKDVHKAILEREEFQAETIDARIRRKVAFLDEDEDDGDASS
jgi:hypothetical protein